MGCTKSSTKRKVYSNISLPQETRKTSNKQPNLTSKAIKKLWDAGKVVLREKFIAI